jgi:hypothetical protein
VEIAPLKRGFGQGKNGINWLPNQAYEHATQIIAHLVGAIEVGQTHQKCYQNYNCCVSLTICLSNCFGLSVLYFVFNLTFVSTRIFGDSNTLL